MRKTKLNKRTIIATLLIVIGAIGIGHAATLWVIDSMSHYITVSPIEGYMEYSLDNGTWVNIASVSAGMPWYARLHINYDGIPKSVHINWALLVSPDEWVPLTDPVTSFALTQGLNIIYVSGDGISSSANYNWGQRTTEITVEFNYRVSATITGT